MNSRSCSRREFLRTTSLALPLAAGGCATGHRSARTTAKESEFVSIRDGQFRLRGRPHFFIGANLWYGCYLGNPKLPRGRTRLVRELDRLQRIGVTNLRLLAGSESSALAGAVRPGITESPGNWNEDLLQGLDFCLAEMGKRDQRGVLFLTNYWQWSGGMGQYVNWATGESIPDPDRPETGATWGQYMQFAARFYRTPPAKAMFADYVTHVVNRRNTCTGRLYRDDPAIMSWQLANEPRPGTDLESAREHLPAFYGWVDETARQIHTLDPHHLVNPGTEGLIGCLQNPEILVKAYQTPAIDYVNVHLWVKNWGWLKEPQPGAAFEAATTKALAHIEENNALATGQLRKPLTMEEFGIARDGEQLFPGSPIGMRDDYYRRMFQAVVASCRAGRALQGANFWAWGGEGRAQPGNRTAAAVFTGDPFSEPQGLNSVFATDRSTLEIIAEFNVLLRSGPV
jgi:mannan endo-1,4-beta-mannosidase